MGTYGLPRRRSATRSRLMRRLRVAAAIAGLAVIWLGYWVAIEHANQQERRAAAVTVPAQVLAEAGPTPTVEFRIRKKATDQVPGAPTVKLPKFSSARALAVTPHPAAHVPDDVQTLAAAKTDAAPLPDSDLPAHVPFLQSTLSEAHGGGVPGASGRHGAMSGANLPPMWGFSSGATGSAHSPVVTDDAPASIDGRPSVLGHKFSADSGDGTGGTGSNGTGGSSGSGGSNGSNGSTGGSNDQNSGTQGGGTQSAGSGSSSGTGSGGSSATGGSTQGGGSGQGTGGTTGGGNSGSNGGGGSEGGANNSLAASASATNEGSSDVVVDVPEPGSILLGLGLAAAFLRRRAR